MVVVSMPHSLFSHSIAYCWLVFLKPAMLLALVFVDRFGCDKQTYHASIDSTLVFSFGHPNPRIRLDNLDHPDYTHIKVINHLTLNKYKYILFVIQHISLRLPHRFQHSKFAFLKCYNFLCIVFHSSTSK